MKFGVLVMTTYDTPVLRATLKSIVDTYSGPILVSEDGDQPARRCESLAKEMGVSYVKHEEWVNAGKSILKGMKHLDCDVVIITHSDVLFSSDWFPHIEEAWEKVYNHAGVINTQYYGYITGEANHHAIEVYTRADYNSLYNYLTEGPGFPVRVVMNDTPWPIGLARCEHNDKPGIVRMPCTMSPCWSARKDFLSTLRTDIPISSEFNVTVATQLIKNRLWSFTASNQPMIHQSTTDIGLIVRDKGEFRHRDFEYYTEHHGFNAMHVFCTAYADVYMRHKNLILSAANMGNLADVDYLFDVMTDRILNDNCYNCNVWCPVKGEASNNRTLEE